MAILETVKNAILSIHTKMNGNKRTISRKDDEPYLTRYYLFRKPVNWMPSVYLHCFHQSDEDSELHNHPWDKSLSLILSGSYREEFRDKNDHVQSRTVSAGNFNYVTADKFHRIDIQSKEVWTLFISGRKIDDWGFWDRSTGEFIHHETHEAKKEESEQALFISVNDDVERAS